MGKNLNVNIKFDKIRQLYYGINRILFEKF